MNPFLVRTCGCAVALAAVVAFSAAVPTTPALALDLRASIHQHNWTSVYIGGQAGWSRMARHDVLGLRPSTPNCDPGFFVERNQAGPRCPNPARAVYTDSLRGPAQESGSFLGGLHAGALYQTGRFVVGVEGRWDWGTHKSDWCDTSRAACINGKTNWFGAGLAKLGFSRGRSLVYGSLGVAVANSELDVSGFPAENESFTSSDIIYGLAYGAGLSYAVNNRWVLTADYLRYDFDSEADVIRADGDVVSHKQSMTIDTFTARLSYHVGY